MVEDRDIHNFTLIENWTRVKLLRGGSKQLVLRHNNWAIRPDIFTELFFYSASGPQMLKFVLLTCSVIAFQCHDTWFARHRLRGSSNLNILKDKCRGKTRVKSTLLSGTFPSNQSWMNKSWGRLHWVKSWCRSSLRCLSVHKSNWN